MGRWDQLVNNSDVFIELQDFYNGIFPIEVRYFLSQWIEDKKWTEVDLTDPGMEEQGFQLLREMIDLLTAKNNELVGNNDFVIMKMRLEQTCHNFQATYTNSPLEFLKVMARCMEKEIELIEKAKSTPDTAMAPAGELKSEREVMNQLIMGQLQELAEKTQSTEKKYKEVQHRQESFIIQHQEHVRISSQISQNRRAVEQLETTLQQQQQQLAPAQLSKLQTQLTEKQVKVKMYQEEKKHVELQLSDLCTQLQRQRVEITDMYNEIIQQLQTVQKKVLDEELIGWKRRQQLGGNGEPPPKAELDLLQTWCEHLAEIIWNIRQQIRRVSILRAQLPIAMPEGVQDLLPNLNDIITGMLSSLVTSTFIVEQQPPQVLKKEARFSATIRLLVGGRLNIQMNAPQVKATIISEGLAKNMLRSDMKAKTQQSGTILNNIGTMDFHPSATSSSSASASTSTSTSSSPTHSGSLSITFRNMQLKKITRSDKKGSEAVTEEKFCILFQSDFNVGGNDLVFQVWTLSLPVVVTVHGNQECNAMATVLWDNAFSEPGRLPFVVPDQVLWPLLGEQLDRKFKQNTGRGLNQDSLDYLASKIFGVQPSYENMTVSWVQFNKDTLKERPFTFWEWFYAVLKLTKEHLKGPWNDGSIIGFISKTEAQECLNRKENGTFLLRFSDSECGGITIAWIAESNIGNEREVWNLAPYVTKDFTIRGLADRIHDLKNLETLYPDIPKDQAFSKYYTSPQDTEQPSRHGYVPTHLVTVMVPPPDTNMMSVFSPESTLPPRDTPLTDTDMDEDELLDLQHYLTDYDPNASEMTTALDPNMFVNAFSFNNKS